MNRSNNERVHYVASTTFTLDRAYSELKPIGKGSYGVVCSAFHGKRNRRIAIKKITPMAKRITDAKHVLREIRIMRYMGKHVNIITLEDLIIREQQDELYIVMELLDADLHHIIQSKQELADTHFKFFLHQLLCGVKYLHDHRIIHRDLKPGNLLVSKDCRLRITDFGLARERPLGKGDDPEDEIDEPMTEHVITRWYRPPELMLCPDGLYTYAVDMWSCGCIFAEMLGRNPLFPGKNFIHQLSLVFDVIGSPTSEEVSHITNEEARKFLRSQKNKPKVLLGNIYKNAGPDACSLLSQLLVFNPYNRMDVDDALKCSYLKGIGFSDSTVYPPVSPEFEFSFERPDVTKSQLKQLIRNEAASFRKDQEMESTGGVPILEETDRSVGPSETIKQTHGNKLESGLEKSKSGTQKPVDPPVRCHPSNSHHEEQATARRNNESNGKELATATRRKSVEVNTHERKVKQESDDITHQQPHHRSEGWIEKVVAKPCDDPKPSRTSLYDRPTLSSSIKSTNIKTRSRSNSVPIRRGSGIDHEMKPVETGLKSNADLVTATAAVPPSDDNTKHILQKIYEKIKDESLPKRNQLISTITTKEKVPFDPYGLSPTKSARGIACPDFDEKSVLTERYHYVTEATEMDHPTIDSKSRVSHHPIGHHSPVIQDFKSPEKYHQFRHIDRLDKQGIDMSSDARPVNGRVDVLKVDRLVPKTNSFLVHDLDEQQQLSYDENHQRYVDSVLDDHSTSTASTYLIHRKPSQSILHGYQTTSSSLLLPQTKEEVKPLIQTYASPSKIHRRVINDDHDMTRKVDNRSFLNNYKENQSIQRSHGKNVDGWVTETKEEDTAKSVTIGRQPIETYPQKPLERVGVIRSKPILHEERETANHHEILAKDSDSHIVKEEEESNSRKKHEEDDSKKISNRFKQVTIPKSPKFSLMSWQRKKSNLLEGTAVRADKDLENKSNNKRSSSTSKIRNRMN